MKLTKGEALWILRRRMDETVEEMALLIGTSEEQYRKWEKDREEMPWPLRDIFGKLMAASDQIADPLTAGEASALARRRKGWTLAKLGAVIYRSRVSLIAQEYDRVDNSYLVNCWVLIGWPPRPRGAWVTAKLGDWSLKLLSVPR